MYLIDKPDLQLYCNVLPEPYARCITKNDSEDVVRDKNLYPYKQRQPVDFTIRTKDKEYVFLFDLYKNDPDGFKFDAASIPNILTPIIGEKADPSFLVPSYIHDILCSNKDMIGRDRLLSSIIFKELLLYCNPKKKFKADVMFFFVDNFQKLFCKW